MVSTLKNARVIYEVEIYERIGDKDYDLIFRDFYRNKRDAEKDVKKVSKNRDVESHIHLVHPRNWFRL